MYPPNVVLEIYSKNPSIENAIMGTVYGRHFSYYN
jgi:hypothetical protein